MIKTELLSLWRSPAVRFTLLPWAAAFLLLNLVNTQDGGPNAVSRFLTMRSMSEEATFTINTRTNASTDWSKTPDGNYYSNKAPGPMLLGFPTFFLIDQVPRLWEKGYRDEHGQRHTPGYFQKTWTSFLNQILPLLLIVAFILAWYRQIGVSRGTQVYFLLAVFFGSTVSMYFNNYSGHAFNAILQLGGLYALLRGHYKWVGFFFGGALLSDYSFVMQIPALLVALALALKARRELWRPLGHLMLGAIVPGALWIWYHTAAFGSPFLVANHFQNPLFLDTINESVQFLGIFRIPQLFVLWELLFGSGRGLLVTQPWILFLLPVALFSLIGRRPPAAASENPDLPLYRRVAAAFCVLSLAGLIVMNMSYGAWQGGGASGPRYISGVFLCFALWIGLELDRFPLWARAFYWLMLGVSLLFRAIVYGTTILGPGTDLWRWYIFTEFAKPSWTPQLRFVVFSLVMSLAWYWHRRLTARHLEHGGAR